MNSREYVIFCLNIVILVLMLESSSAMTEAERHSLREKVKEMFHHAYDNYMKHAYPADELMPLSCRGRVRGKQPNRGDIDDSLGNFSLTLIDTLDTLVVLGELSEFERAVRLVVKDVSFDTDIVVSVFETNIRVLGGLLGAHTMAVYLQENKYSMLWYEGELLSMAADLGYRLLPAFNTTTGIPYPRVNLRYGVKHEMSRTGEEKDTCTACAGTMILEFSALSRYTGDPVFEEKAHKAMEYLWKSRHRSSDLVGTVINIHNGDWVRRDSGVGAGIDSYYEYLLKAYILLGDETYLDRFNKHYTAIMRYINQGPLLMDVHMHKPMTNTRNFMDALLAFWPGLQVLKGDIKPAIEIHEMLYQVVQRHNFLPEAFTSDFRVHWGQHPLRPEFLESTFYIYKATGDPHYLEVGKSVLENLEKHARVPCGFAAIKDVTTGIHEDQLDSYVLAETFKYLFLLFSEKDEVILDVDEFVFTTEAHLLPLSVSMQTPINSTSQDSIQKTSDNSQRTCPNAHHMFKGTMNFAQDLRLPLKNMVNDLCPKSPTQGTSQKRKVRLRASEFMTGNKEQLEQLKRMGIRIITMSDGRIQLLHTSSEAGGAQDAEDGMVFMQEMIELSKQQAQEAQQEPRIVQFLSHPFLGNRVLNAGPAQFGKDLKTSSVKGQLTLADPYRACSPLNNEMQVRGKIAVMERGDCMFVDKARYAMSVGAIGGIVIDSTADSSVETASLFAMSGDGKEDVSIPMVFLFHKEGSELLQAMESNPDLSILLAFRAKPVDDVMRELLQERDSRFARSDKPPTGKLTSLLQTLQLDRLGFTWQAVWSDDVLAQASVADRLSDSDAKVSYVVENMNKERPLSSSSARLADELLDVMGRLTNINEHLQRDEFIDAVREATTKVMTSSDQPLSPESVEVIDHVTSDLKMLESSPWDKVHRDEVSHTDSASTGGSDVADVELSQQINQVLDQYIVEQLTKVVNELEDPVKEGSHIDDHTQEPHLQTNPATTNEEAQTSSQIVSKVTTTPARTEVGKKSKERGSEESSCEKEERTSQFTDSSVSEREESTSKHADDRVSAGDGEGQHTDSTQDHSDQTNSNIAQSGRHRQADQRSEL